MKLIKRIGIFLLLFAIVFSSYHSVYAGDNPGVKRLSVSLIGGTNVAKAGGRWMTLGGQFDRSAGYNPVFGGSIAYAVTQPVSFEFAVYRGLFDRDEEPDPFRNEYWQFTVRGIAYLNNIFQTYGIGSRVNPYISMGFGRMINDIEVVDGADRDFTVSTYMASLGFKFHINSTIDVFAGYEYQLANTDFIDATPGRFTRDTWGQFLAGISINIGRSGAKHVSWHPRGKYVDEQLDRYDRELRDADEKIAELEQRDAERDEKLAGVLSKIEEQNSRIETFEEMFKEQDARIAGLESIISIRLDADIVFAFDSPQLNEQAMAVLDELIGKLTDEPRYRVRVIGHTDSTGPAEYNQRLSERRAQSVANYLIDQGISTERISTIGMGENEPIATNETTEGRRLNRRVDVELWVAE